MKKYKVKMVRDGNFASQRVVQADSEDEAAQLTFYDMSGDFKFDTADFSATIEISVKEL